MNKKKITSLILIIFLSISISFSGFAADHFTENFSGGPSDYFTGQHTFSSGLTWDLGSIKGESAANAVGGFGGAARFLINTSAYVTSPSVNTLGSITFQYRELNDIGGGSFKVQVSVDGGAFSDVATQSFSGTTYQTFTMNVNYTSNNVRVKVVGTNTTYLIVDEMTLASVSTDPELSVSTSSLTGFTYVETFGPSSEQSFNLSGLNLDGTDVIITAPTNYEISKTSGSGFISSTLTYTAYNGATTTIFVRLKSGLAVGTYNSEAMSISGGGAASSQTVTCNGNVTAIPDPELIVNPTALSGFSYVVGTGPSISQSYTLSGTYLTGYPGNITVNAPANYEVSTDNSTFSSSLSVAYSSATLASTTIFVRLNAGLSVANYNSEIITNAGGGATTVNVTCSGLVEDVPPPTLVASETTLSGFSYIIDLGPSVPQTYDLSGTYLTGYPGNITITAPINYEISTDDATYLSSLDIPYTSATLASTTIYVRLKAGLAIGAYNSEIITNTGGGATTINVTCNGDVLDIPSESVCENFDNQTSNTYSTTGYTMDSGNWTCNAAGNFAYANTNMGSYAFTINDDNAGAHITTPAMNTCGTVSFKYAYINGNETNVFVLQKSTDGTTFTDLGTHELTALANLNYVDYSFDVNDPSATVYIRILSDNQNAHLFIEDFCWNSYGSAPTPTLSLSTSSLSGFTYVEGNGPSTEQSFDVSGTNLDGNNVTITPSLNYEISSTSGSGFVSTPITLSAFDGTSTTIYVRLIAGLTTNTYNSEIISVAGGGASTVNITCNGEVTALPSPILVVSTSTLSGFTYVEGNGPSSEQSFDVSGTNLDGNDVTITPSLNYEISSTSGSGFVSTPIILNAFDGTSTTIYVRLIAGLTANAYNSEIISVAGGGATTVNVTCNGIVTIDAPTSTCENFDNQTSNTYSTTGYTMDSGNWTCNAAGNFAYANTNMGSYAFTINDDNVGAHITTPTMNTCGTVSFKYAYINGNETNVFVLQKSTDGTTFTDLDTHELTALANLNYVDYSFDVNELSSTVYIRILSDNQNAHLFIEDFCWTDYLLGVNEKNNKESNIIIYPNPTSGSFNVLLNNSEEILSIELINISGQSVFFNDKNSSKTFNLNLEQGIYFVKVNTLKNTYVKRLLIN